MSNLIDKAKAAGALGAKVCGAGGGGCLFCYAQPETRKERGRGYKRHQKQKIPRETNVYWGLG
ncbi:MAG TPA: hypothetical protein EYP98_21205, partial [Planctomycetes bacterium]|nr:hypothetical protein [Planctomycetota bacterium]